MSILKHPDILKLHAAVISAQLVASRSALLVGIDGHFVAGLPHAANPSDQILEDLSAMNDTGALADGAVPLAFWLKNAVARAGGKKEAATFRNALARCHAPPSVSRGAAPRSASAHQPRPTTTAGPKPIDVFFSYSPKDEVLRDELATHVKLLERNGVIRSWHDRRIGAGQNWKQAIDQNLEQAEVILLLVSADFLASDYCFDVEMKRALEKCEAGEAAVIPVILRECDWSGAPFARLQALPKDGKPVTKWSNRDEAWKDVALGIQAAVQQFCSNEATAAALNDNDRRAEPAAPKPPPTSWPTLLPVVTAPPQRVSPAPSPNTSTGLTTTPLPLKWPGGCYESAWYVHRPQEERKAENQLNQPGAPVILRGPAGFGKSMLLGYLLERVRERDCHDGKRTPIIQFDLREHLPEPGRVSFEGLLAMLAQNLLDETSPVEAWRPEPLLAPNLALNRLLERRLRAATTSRLIMVVEHADALRGLPLHDPFYNMLRAWVTKGSSEPWSRLRLILALSTTPEQILHGPSIFNMQPQIELDDLTVDQIVEMARLYGLDWNREMIDASVIPRIGGNPLLVAMLTYEASLFGRTLQAVLEGDGERRLYDKYMSDLGRRLDDARLLGAVRTVLENPAARLDETDKRRLIQAGVIAPSGQGHRLRYPLYESYFSRLWRLVPGE